VTGDGRGQIVTTSGRQSQAWVGVFHADGSEVGRFLAHPDFQGGLYLGVQGPLGRPLVLTDPAVRAVEGARAEVLVAVSDPDHAEAVRDVAATVFWGDRTSSLARVTALADGRIGILGYHRYRHAGVYSLAVGATGSLHRYTFATGE